MTSEKINMIVNIFYCEFWTSSCRVESLMNNCLVSALTVNIFDCKFSFELSSLPNRIKFREKIFRSYVNFCPFRENFIMKTRKFRLAKNNPIHSRKFIQLGYFFIITEIQAFQVFYSKIVRKFSWLEYRFFLLKFVLTTKINPHKIFGTRNSRK